MAPLPNVPKPAKPTKQVDSTSSKEQGRGRGRERGRGKRILAGSGRGVSEKKKSGNEGNL